MTMFAIYLTLNDLNAILKLDFSLVHLQPSIMTIAESTNNILCYVWHIKDFICLLTYSTV